MGCDIHCYVEYTRAGTEHWSGFGGRINPGRNYALFALIAGVRNCNEVTPIIPPRGFPDNAAYDANDDRWLCVTDTEGEGFCTRAQAEDYVQYGSVWRDEEKKFVSHPDHHTHTWLTPDEWAKATEEAGLPEYHAITAALRSFEHRGYVARVVIWFDN